MAIRINASGEYLRRTANLPSETAFTLCGWARGTDRGTTYQYWGLENATSNSTAYQILGWRNNGNFEVAENSGGGVTLAEPSSEQWFFWAIVGAVDTTSGIVLRLGTDSVLQSVSTNPGDYTPALLSLGNDSYDEYLNMAYAHVKVWDAALTRVELEREIWSARPQRFADLNLWSPLISDYKDYSGNGRDWTAAGTPTYEDGPPVSWGASPHIVGNPSTEVALYVTWGEAAPDADEQDLSWSLWQTAPATPVVVSGDGSWGKLTAYSGETCYSSVVDMGSSAARHFTVQRDKYGTGSGNVTISIRGSATSFAQHDGSPSWSTYTVVVTQTWRYVQLKIEYAA